MLPDDFILDVLHKMKAIDESPKVYELPNVLDGKASRDLNLEDPCIIEERILDFSIFP